MWKQIKTYTAAWTRRTFSVDFYQNLDLALYSRAAGLCYDGVTPPVPVVYTTTTTTPPHYCWTPEPANEMVKLSTSAGSLCPSWHPQPQLWPGLWGSSEIRQGQGLWDCLGGDWGGILQWCHSGQTMCALSSSAQLISTLCFSSPSCLQPAAMIPALLFYLLCVCVTSQSWALDTGQ